MTIYHHTGFLHLEESFVSEDNTGYLLYYPIHMGDFFLLTNKNSLVVKLSIQTLHIINQHNNG